MCLCNTQGGQDLLGGTLQQQKHREVLPTNVVPSRYNVHLAPSLETFTFSGSVAITASVVNPTTSIVLNNKGLNVTTASVSFNGVKLVGSVVADATKELVAFEFVETIPIGAAVINCEFAGIHKNQLTGFYRSSYTNEKGEEHHLLSTQCCATDCRQVFPCFDEPALKATFDYTFVVADGLVVLTNTQEVSCRRFETETGKKVKEVKFATTPLMSTYLVAFVIGDLECIESVAYPSLPADAQPITVRVFTTKGLAEQGRFALNVAVKTLIYFNEYFDIAYPLVKSDLVAIPNFGFGAMENWGLITYRTTALLCDEMTATSAAKKQIAYTVAHELAHQWFGNLVTMSWWNDLWLNEGFATFVGWLATDFLFPEWDVWTGYLTNVLAGALNLDSLRSSHPIDVHVTSGTEALQVLDAISYLKGSSIIRMLKEFLGGDVFMNGVRSYLQEFKYKNTVTSDLWKHLSLSSGKDIGALMDAWINETGYPLVSVESEVYDDETKTLTVALSQSRFLSGGALKLEEDHVTWWVPVTVVSHLTGKGSPSSHVLSNKQGTIKFPYDASTDAFWKLNFGASGMYRVKYLDSQVAIIGHILHTKPESFSVSDRIMFISDAYSLTSAGLTNVASVLDLIKALDSVQDYNVLSQISTTLSALRSISYLESETVREGIKALGRRVFSSKVEQSGFEYPESEEYFAKVKRALVISEASSSGDEVVKIELRDRFDMYVAGDTTALHPELRSVAYSSVLSNATEQDAESLFTAILDIYMKPTTQPKEKSDILSVIGTVNSSALVDKILNEIMFDASLVRTQDFTSPLVGLASVGKSRPLLLAWMKNNWNRICTLFEGSEMRLGAIFSACVGSCIGLGVISEVEAWVRGDGLDQEALANHKKVLSHFSRSVDQTLESHGRRIWEKKMTQSVSHNKAQLMNQATDLITHGRITTTVPKAKVLKHYADQIINIAKENNLSRLRKSVYVSFYSLYFNLYNLHSDVYFHVILQQPDATVPKLQLLAARYKDRVGGYTRLTLDGYNRPGSDRAPLATIEYIDNASDSIHFLASKYLPKVKEDLKEIQARKYNTQEITLEDPMNPGSLITAYKRTLRADVNSKLIKQLAVKERYLQNLINKFERSLSSFEKSRVYEQEYLKEVEVQNEAKSLAKLRLLQEKVDSMDAKKRAGFVDKYNEQQATKNLIRVLKMDGNGDLFWEIKKLPEVAEVKKVAAEQAKEVPAAEAKAVEGESGEKATPAKGAVKMLGNLMKKLKW
ncbi:UNVERIFIED_CONTAM: hypothetical protein HDU68_003661 [Siphonaria sp. JEL0065]|nr:hypothetical protein HDU68_003661 [Siphonaria sp. JEL0065]